MSPSHTILSREDKVLEFDSIVGNGENWPYYTAYLELKMNLIKEEVRELGEALETQLLEIERGKTPDYSETLKELADLQYVLSGLVNALGFRKIFEAAFNRVHLSNLSKLVDGKPLKREDGKVLKGPNYKPPIMKDLLPHV